LTDKYNQIVNNKDIQSFKIISNYPNYNNLRFFLNEKFNNIEQKGYLPPKVRYLLKNGKKGEITISFGDLILLMRNKNNAKKYLKILISAENGDKTAEEKIFIQRKKISEILKRYNNNVNFFEDEFVVPSITNKTYNSSLLGHKGKMLLELTQSGYPVPDFCILTSKTYSFNNKERKKHIKKLIRNMELMTGQKINSEKKPLILAFRCCMPQYIPGFMPTYLNIGVTHKVYLALKKIYNKKFANTVYSYTLKNIYSILFRKEISLNNNNIENKIDFLIKEINKKDPVILNDAVYQITFFVDEMKKFFEKNKDVLYTITRSKLGLPSLIIQKMVWTIGDDKSYPGVIHTRHSRTGLGVQIESHPNIFGEEIMTGNTVFDDYEYFNKEEIRNKYPAIYHFQLLFSELEKKLRSPATIEFAVENNCIYSFFSILQLNSSEITGRASLLSAIKLYEDKIIDKSRVLELIQPYHLRQIFSDTIEKKSFKSLEFFTNGVSVLPRSAVSAKIFFSAEGALESKKAGFQVCLCKEKFDPTDTVILNEMDCIISLNPAAIHVLTACLGYGIPALINLEKNNVRIIDKKLINSDNKIINEGEWITISSKGKKIFKGKAKYIPARFRKYLKGEKLIMPIKEERVFINLKNAYQKYQEIVKSLRTDDILNLDYLVKLIRNDLKDEPEKSKEIINKWFDNNTDEYIKQILNSELGSHKEQHNLYNFLTIERKIKFFKKIIKVCNEKKLSGLLAGSFMLGRFICLIHPVKFWENLNYQEIAFLLNEYILFEKYLIVLEIIGNKKIRNRGYYLLDNGLEDVDLNYINTTLFTTLKLSKNNISEIKKFISEDYDKYTIKLVNSLEQPYGKLFDYNNKWSINELKKICKNENLPLPDENSK